MSQHDGNGSELGEGATRFLATLGRSVEFDAIPDDVIRRLKFCVLDWLGVTLLGSTSELGEIVRDVACRESSVGEATVFGGDFGRIGVVNAALANGAASHAHDFDDGSGTSGLPHSMVTILPALFAFAEERELSGRKLLEAICAGQEVGVRVTAIMGREHYAMGFHKMATNGAFLASAACARLLDFTLDQWLVAFGISGSQASGLKANFGTMVKPLHAGLTASGSVLACLLAERGFTANPAIIEAKNGYAFSQAPDPHWGSGFRPLDRPFVVEGMRFKYHAACSGTHSSIEAIRFLRRSQGVRPEDVESIAISVAAQELGHANIQWPKTALEAKFSIRHAASLALLDWDTTERGFTDELAEDPRIREIEQMITVGPLEGATTNDDTLVKMTLRDGRRLERRHRFADHRLTMDQEWESIVEKFVRCATSVLTEDGAYRVVSLVGSLEEETSVRAFVEELVGLAAVARPS